MDFGGPKALPWSETMLKKVEAIVKPFKMDEVK